MLALPSQAGPSRLPAKLPFFLDFSCPVALPSRSIGGTPWPFEHCGPASHEPPIVFLRRRYLETLFLSDLILSLSDFLADIQRIDALICGTLLLTLPELETRHRKVLQPLISTLVSVPSSGYAPGVQQSLLDEATHTAGLASDEVGVIKTGIELRMGSRRAEEEAVNAKKLSEEFERREALLQLILLLTYMPVAPRKRKKREVDPSTAVELLMDRLSIWAAVADLGLGDSAGDNGMQELLKRFWDEVMVSFLPKQPDLCASFHLKVFAKDLALPTKPKPKPKPKPTSASRAPSEAGSSRTETETSRRRSFSKSESIRRSRSRSIDLPRESLVDLNIKRPLVRAPSGRDMFKGREVQLRRTTSVIKKGVKESQGLLGRKSSTSNIGDKRRSIESVSSTVGTTAETLVLATPSKPRYGYSVPFHHPTPIQEEPERPSFIAETPVANRIGGMAVMEEEEGEDEESLGELMVMTDDEDAVPDTPR